MKRTVKVKNLIAFTAVLILLFSITVVPAYAEFPTLTPLGRRVGSWILSGLTALNIAVTSTVSTSQGADIINFLGDPFDNIYSYTEFWEDKPTIQIWDDYTTIDGVTYTDIWLSNEAAHKFKTDGMDFATAYSIASNTNGTFASGVGYSDDTPIFTVNGENRTQDLIIPGDGTYQIADAGVRTEYRSYPGAIRFQTDPHLEGDWNGVSKWQYSNYPLSTYIKYNSPTGGSIFLNGANVGGISSTYVPQAFDFDWVAGTIDATPLAPDEGIMIRVPSDTPGLQTFITNNNYLTEPTTIDVDLDPTIETKLDDLIDIIAPIIPILTNNDIQFTINHPEPTPPAPQPQPAPDVDPDTPIDQITYNDYYQTITNQTEYINNTVNNIDNSLTEINENVTNVNNNLDLIELYTDNIQQDTAHIDAGVTYISQDTQVMVENQDTIIQNQDQMVQNQDTIIYNQDQMVQNQETIIQNQDQIIENQDTIIQESIPDIIDNIPKIDEICNNIDTAPYHDLDTGITRLPSFFLPFITDLRSALGIWHYVTEWLSQISSTFAFVSGCLVGTSIMTPIYAAIAGFMCIKIYRRMTA